MDGWELGSSDGDTLVKAKAFSETTVGGGGGKRRVARDRDPEVQGGRVLPCESR
jgi:hypothetical protein